MDTGIQRGTWYRTMLPGFRVTATGYLYFAMVAAVGIASLNTEANLLLLVFGLGLGVFITASLVTTASLRHLDVTRIVPPVATAGRPFTIRYHLTSRRRWRCAFSLNVTDRVVGDRLQGGMPEAYVPVVRPGASASVGVTASALRRGRLAFSSIALETSFPLSLFVRSRPCAAGDEMLIYPAPGRLRRAVWGPRAPHDTTESGRRPTGFGVGEFYGLREYRYGDNPRWIHWRRSARTGQLLVREMAEHRPPRGLVVLDLPPPDASRDARCERAIRFAATLCCDGLDKGYQIGLAAAAEPAVVLQPSAGRRQRARLLAALAVVSGNGGRVGEALRHTRWPIGWRGLRCVVVAAAERDRTDALVAWLTSRGAHVTRLVAGTPTFEDVFDDCGHTGVLGS